MTGNIYVTRDVIWLQRMFHSPSHDHEEMPVLTIGAEDLAVDPLVNVPSREGESDDAAANESDDAADNARKVQFRNTEVEIKFEDEDVASDVDSLDSLFPESDTESEEEEEQGDRNETAMGIGSTRLGRAFREMGSFSAD